MDIVTQFAHGTHYWLIGVCRNRVEHASCHYDDICPALKAWKAITHDIINSRHCIYSLNAITSITNMPKRRKCPPLHTHTHTHTHTRTQRWRDSANERNPSGQEKEKSWGTRYEARSRRRSSSASFGFESLAPDSCKFSPKFAFFFLAHRTWYIILKALIYFRAYKNAIVSVRKCGTLTRESKFGGVRYETRSRGRSCPDSSAFWACETTRRYSRLLSGQ